MNARAFPRFAGAVRAVRLLSVTLLGLGLLFAPAEAAIQVQVSGPGGSAGQALPDEGGSFDLSIPLNRNAVNNIRVTATDDAGNRAEQELAITQVSLDSVVVSQIKSERLSVERVEQLVADGVIQLDDPANYHVSTFDIVLTIAQRQVPISVPIAIPIDEKPAGWEKIKLPYGRDDGGAPPKPREIEVMVFEEILAGPGGVEVTIPGVLVIEGRIKSLKEFYSVRLLLMNTSGIFTLTEVGAEITFPDGGLTSILPADGVISFGDILPGDGTIPGQKEKEFIIRGDEIGVRHVVVDYGGTLTGPGIDEPIPFNGSAVTDVEVKGPPTLDVEVTHPDYVTTGEPYELSVEITNTDTIPAMYASIELDVGFDGELVRCEIDALGEPLCTEIEGADVRNLGHILPGETVTEVFTIRPTKTGPISSCMAAADQNISLRVLVGTIGCLIGEFPPDRIPADGTPAVSVLPSPNATGIHTDSPVVAFFSEPIDETTITTGEGGSLNVFDNADNRLPGQLRIEPLNDKTVAVWQLVDNITNRLVPNKTYTVVVTTAIRDEDGNAMKQQWSSSFTTTGTGTSDITPPELSLSVHPSVDPNYVLPGQIIKVNAYAADQGSGIARVEARLKDLDAAEPAYLLIDQKTVYQGDLPPFIFAIDSAGLNHGHAYQLLVTAYDGNGNTRDATLSLIIAASADPPTIVLPADPTQPVLHGISVTVTPVSVSGGVRRVLWYLDRPGQDPTPNPFASVSLAPFSATVPTLGLDVLGTYGIRAVAIDGLGQMGTDDHAFELVDNPNEPVISFGAAVDGTQYAQGADFTVRPSATDPVGLTSFQVYVDDPGASQPLTVSGPAVTVNTSGLSLGAHQLYVHATNQLGVSNDLTDPDSWLAFSVVEPPPGAPPDAPTITDIAPPSNGQALVQGTTVAGARVELTNLSTGLTVTVTANAAGAFSRAIEALAGQEIRVLAYDYGQSPDPSEATTTTVPAAPVLQSISVSPTAWSFTQAGAYKDLTVTGHYDTGATANLTTSAGFTTSNSAVATVSAAGRVAAVASGSATITATVSGLQAQTAVSVDIVVLTGIQVTPSPVAMTWLGQTAQLQVIASYSNGTQQDKTGSASFSSANGALASVNSSGRVTGIADGSTQIYCSIPGLAPVTVPVSVNSGLDNPPSVAIQSPADGSTVQRGQTINVSVHATDAEGGVTSVTLSAGGETSFNETRQIAPASNDTTLGFSFPVADAATVGGNVTIQVTAVDTSGRTSQASIALLVVDTTAPAVSILGPAQQAGFNYGDTVEIRVRATDAVGVTRIRYQTSGALSLSGSQTFSGESPAEALFSFTVPYGVTDPDLRIIADARDAAGNEGTSAPVDVILTDADITPPATQVTAVTDPGSAATVTLTYEVTDGLADLDHVELYFRRNGIGTFNRYTGADGSGNGEYQPQSGAVGTIVFDSTRMGGDGGYEFATLGVDLAGNREALPRSGSAYVGDPGATATFATGAPVTLISTNLEIADGTYDDHNLRIDGATVTLVGDRRFHNVELRNGAVLTHRETTRTETYGLVLDAWTLTIDGTSGIDVTARGYEGGRNYDESGLTVGNVTGAGPHNGGSFGGLGGHSTDVSAQPNPVYGNLSFPTDLGSGGGAYGNTDGGDGGGRVLIQAINLASNGAIRADGGQTASSPSGMGSGGSVNITVRSLSGTGTVEADGGTRGGTDGVGGGGGRIAIRFLDLSAATLPGITAAGGNGYYADGADGTVYLLTEGQTSGDLVINGQGPSSPYTDLLLPSGQTFGSVILQNGAHVIAQDRIVVSDALRLTGGSLLTQPSEDEAGLQIEAARVIVESGSAIDVTARGYRGGQGYDEPGRTLGNLVGSGRHNGGSHGGLGAHYADTGEQPGAVYGDPEHPDHLGGGGGAYGSTDGGAGGGFIRILASDEVVVDGAIRADGASLPSSPAGMGAGGSVWITTSRLAGSGSISADGGNRDSADCVGGGGGRVAIYADYVDPNHNLGDLRAISAFRGRGWYDNPKGSAGTVYLEINGVGELIIDDNESSTTSPNGTPLPLMGPGVAAAVSADSLTTDGVVPLLPNALVGLRINPDADQDESFVILSNTASEIVVETPNEQGASFATLAAGQKTYVGDYRYDNLTFRRGGHLVVGDRLRVPGNLTIAEHALLTHPETTLTYDGTLDLTAGELTIDATSSIDVSARGYLGGQGYEEAGHTIRDAAGNELQRAGRHNGGSYGGLGGHYTDVAEQPNPIYGSLSDPVHLGSGGGAYGNTDGGDGGGRIFILADTLVNDGAIRADGGAIPNTPAGMGSGGTVNLNVGTLSGTGTIEADGGTRDGQDGVGGGGGRIAIRYSTGMSLPVGNVRAIGGDGYYADGQSGTLYIQPTGP